MNLELSPKERVFLANQLRILEALYPAERVSYAQWREAVEGGYALHYAQGAQWLDMEMSPDECREVLDILEMFRTLKLSYDKLDDKSGIEAHSIKFPGFDGNNETMQLGYAHYFIITLDRYIELKDAGDSLNSHMPLMESYRRMLSIWKPLRNKFPLSPEQIKTIVHAAIHPDNRP